MVINLVRKYIGNLDFKLKGKEDLNLMELWRWGKLIAFIILEWTHLVIYIYIYTSLGDNTRNIAWIKLNSHN